MSNSSSQRIRYEDQLSKELEKYARCGELLQQQMTHFFGKAERTLALIAQQLACLC